ncbi:MAG: AAA family ATPase [Pirellulales bacterium]
MSKNLEIFATFRQERMAFQNETSRCVIARAQLSPKSLEVANSIGITDAFITIKGDADEGELVAGVCYRFMGLWKDYTNRNHGTTEKQFCFNSFVEHIGHDRQSLINYLAHAGKGNGIGHGKAAKLVDQVGIENVLDFCRVPANLIEAAKIDAASAERFAEILKEQQRTENALLEIDSLLTGKGFPKSLPRKLIKDFGTSAAEEINRDPFVLMNYHGVGFKKADNLWLLLGKPANDVHRVAMCLWYSMFSDTSGSTWFYGPDLVRKLQQQIGGQVDYRAAITYGKQLAIEGKHFGAIASERTDEQGFREENGKCLWLSEHVNYLRENLIVQAIAEAQFESKRHVLTTESNFIEIDEHADSIWPEIDDIPLISDHQREELRNAIGSPTKVALLTGSPGSGKTFVVAQLLKAIIAQGKVSLFDIVVGAPTGKAAVRLTETFQAYGLPIVARTWHSILFGMTGDCKLHGKLLVCDETSMDDLELLARIFCARPVGCHVLLVGDPYQLPPVGSGAPFRDLIRSQTVPGGHLTKIERNAGEIVEICARIRDGKEWLDLLNVGNVISHYATSPEQQIEILENELRGRDKWETQVVCPVNDKSKVSRKELNTLLQKLQNADGEPVKGTRFRLGDKVVCTKNGWYQPSGMIEGVDEADINDRNEIRVANGEIAEVVNLHPKGFIARLEAPRRFVVVPVGRNANNDKDTTGTDTGMEAAKDGEQLEKPESESDSKADKSTGCNWDLGYALSVHKSQGSEFPYVYAIIDEYSGARSICDASFWLTTISRAKTECHLIGKPETAQRHCSRWQINDRRTFLRERLIEELVSKELEAI